MRALCNLAAFALFLSCRAIPTATPAEAARAVYCLLQINPTLSSDTSRNQVIAFSWSHWTEEANWYTQASLTAFDYENVDVQHDIATRSIYASTPSGSLNLNVTVYPQNNADIAFESLAIEGVVTCESTTVEIASNDIEAYGAACHATNAYQATSFPLCHQDAIRC
ncbi:uncharacterized protein L969DRAFT_92016 [Mixia osmundae IAM 14324]|uniref:Uncharacterized protein n=1 Tax=Mixia osmundae (strain CBS 9802 / IAM 14324 / JCM 22182 / KY 12970) TaxID=764103 RepID=G7DZE5_MIXOS|nr:uncharacterized protein L969DRAFT_92016 [Mixia osmundae IAM 14324]KEI42580.1 hypothetical protein L969DRAFT_92016 [Mixia osmundae IAM 14324]GAA95955.1 hypothetical protein E5Q_02613 [Mixia osmundae IAM 14324]